MLSLFDDIPDRNGGTARGESRKQFAFSILEAHCKAFVIDARRALLNHLLAFGTGTINDARRAVPLPPGINPVVMGAIPGQLAKAGIIRVVGRRKTDRPEAHARELKIWALADPSKAQAWLTAHPSI